MMTLMHLANIIMDIVDRIERGHELRREFNRDAMTSMLVDDQEDSK